jgi:hypothetical protein
MQGGKSTAARGPEFQMVNNFRVGFEFGHMMHFAPKILPEKKKFIREISYILPT